MLKYLLVPRWLLPLLSENRKEATVCMDFTLMTQLLTSEEMACYVFMNTPAFSDRLQDLSSRKALYRLHQSTSTINILLKALESQDKRWEYFLTDLDLNAIVNGVFHTPPLTQGPLTLRPTLLGRGVFGFIPYFATDYQPVLVRDDIYKTLKEFQTVSEILQSPLFGL